LSELAPQMKSLRSPITTNASFVSASNPRSSHSHNTQNGIKVANSVANVVVNGENNIASLSKTFFRKPGEIDMGIMD
jgi:hypothetical protein